MNNLMKERISKLDKNFIENFKFKQYKYDKNKLNGIYAFDIETTSIEESNECIVYSTMLMNVLEHEDICLHNGNKKDLVDNLENLPYLETTIYAHNGGRFDYNCIIDEFINRGYKIEYCEVDEIDNDYVIEKSNKLPNEEKIMKMLFKNNTFYSIEINVKVVPVEFYKKDCKGHKKGEVKKYKAKKLFLKDSCLMLSGSLKRICKDFMNLDLPKDNLDYREYRAENYKLTHEEKIYCYEDVFSLKHLLIQEFLSNFEVKDNNDIVIFSKPKKAFLTSAGFSLDILKSFMFYDCILTDNYKRNYNSKEAIKLVDEYKKSTNKYNKKDLFRWIFPNLNLKNDNMARSSYFGGLSATGRQIHNVNKKGEYNYKPEEVGCVLDENSMYPDKMKNVELPFGQPVKLSVNDFKKKVLNKNLKNKMFIVDIRVIGKCELKKGKFPTIRIGGENNPNFSKKNIFISNKIDKFYTQVYSTMTSIDYYDFIDTYDVSKIIINDNMVFNTNKGFFETFINYFYGIKCNSKGAIKQNGKLILNSVYGKFGTKKINDRYTFDIEDNIFKPQKEEKQSLSESVYVPLASAITSYARHDLKTVAETVGVEYVDYFDTDSLHFRINSEYVKSKFKKIDGKKLGYWDIEGIFDKGIYLGSKRYAEHILQKDGTYKWEVKCCGIPKENQEYFANNIELFDYCNLNKKFIQKNLENNLIKPTNKGLYIINDVFAPLLIKGICQTIKTHRGINGIVFENRPYMITK